VVAGDSWFHIPEQFPLRGRISRKIRLFRVLYGTLFVLSLRVTRNVLRRLHSFHPLVDIPQIYPSYVTLLRDVPFSSYPPPKVILCHSISNGDNSVGLYFFKLARWRHGSDRRFAAVY